MRPGSFWKIFLRGSLQALFAIVLAVIALFPAAPAFAAGPGMSCDCGGYPYQAYGTGDCEVMACRNINNPADTKPCAYDVGCPTTATNSATLTATQSTTQSATTTNFASASASASATATATTSASATITQSSTSTNTSASTATASSGISSSGTQTSLSTSTEASTNTDMNQNEAQTTAAQVNNQGSQNAAGVGVVQCAEAANLLLTDPEAGAVLMESCQQGLNAAEALNQLSNRGLKNAGLEPLSTITANQGITDSPQANEIFIDLENNFGITKAAFIAAMLESKGDPTTLTTLLGDKVPADKLEKAMAAANALSPEQKQAILGASRVAGLKGSENKVASAKAKVPRRESLRTRLAATLQESAEPSSEKAPAGSAEAGESAKANPQLANLKASDETFFSDAKPEELSLFDVVHRKYTERRKLLFVPKASPR